jgi:hypothetical protein
VLFQLARFLPRDLWQQINFCWKTPQTRNKNPSKCTKQNRKRNQEQKVHRTEKSQGKCGVCVFYFFAYFCRLWVFRVKGKPVELHNETLNIHLKKLSMAESKWAASNERNSKERTRGQKTNRKRFGKQRGVSTCREWALASQETQAAAVGWGAARAAGTKAPRLADEFTVKDRERRYKLPAT